jgi:hypothetical protein
MEMTLFIYGICCVAVTVAWRGYLDHRERRAALRRMCQRVGHDWGEPFGSAFGTHCSCRRCKLQRHRLRDGSWSN